MSDLKSEDLQVTGISPVWLASYPRSGNTFLRIIFEQVFGLPSFSRYYIEGQAFHDPSINPLKSAPRLPTNWKSLIDDGDQSITVLIKTHDRPDDNRRAIYIARNAGPAIHSYFHYHQYFAFEKPTLAAVIAGDCQFGDWTSHLREWQPQTRPNTLFLRYENLVGNTDKAIKEIAEFLNREPTGSLQANFAELKSKDPDFFRRGVNSDFSAEWSARELGLLNALHGDAIRELGYAVPNAPQAGAAELKELARIAARSHALYLKTLNGSL